MMYLAVVLLVVSFGSSSRLADAFGMAESGTLFASTILLMVVARYVWPRKKMLIYMLGVVLVGLEGAFVIACSAKFLHGAWIPLAIAVVVLVVMTTWGRGKELVSRERRRREGPLLDYINQLANRKDVVRTNSTAIYLAHHPGYTPLALRATVERLHELSQSVVVVTVHIADVPHVAAEKRAVVNELGNPRDGVVQVELGFGFNEVPNVPHALAQLLDTVPEMSIDLDSATYFISDSDIMLARQGALNRWRAKLFVGLHRISAPSPEYFRLPPDQTIDMASYVTI